MPGPLTRIVSDLHYQDGDCRLHTLTQLEPLMAGVQHFIFNGDCLDTQRTPNAERHVADLRAFASSRCPLVTFITGNHDPVISTQHTLSLAAGEVWVFHGDILYEAIAPWSSIGPRLREEVECRRRKLTTAQANSLAERFRIHREVCRLVHVEFDVARKDLAYRIWRNVRAVFPPRKLLTMLKVWRDMPRDAARLAATEAPTARFIVIGHSHGPTVRETEGRWVINTGSFCRPRGQLCVDLDEQSLRVRRVILQGGAFCPGPVLREFPLAKATTSV